MSVPPFLHVEGDNDIIVISALLFRHGLDTKKGKSHLKIASKGSVDNLLASIPDTIRATTDMPVGFVLDIDVELANRWDAVRGKLKEAGIYEPNPCPKMGYIGQLPAYPHRFGIWLMPDCETDFTMLEHLCHTLVPVDDPLWPFARSSVGEAAKIFDAYIAGQGPQQIAPKGRFRDVHRVKADIHTWLAWQDEPGKPLGAAIRATILSHDSPQALAFLRWLKDLYNLTSLKVT